MFRFVIGEAGRLTNRSADLQSGAWVSSNQAGSETGAPEARGRLALDGARAGNKVLLMVAVETNFRCSRGVERPASQAYV